MDHQELKSDLRKQAKTHRVRFTPPSDSAENLSDRFFDALTPIPGQAIALFWPIAKEIDTTALIMDLNASGIICLLPVIEENTRLLKFAKWTKTMELVKGAYGVMEPPKEPETEWLEPDILCAPMLAFDRRGYRLGYGGGYYDTTIAALRAKNPDMVTVGLAYAEQAVLFPLPVEPHDQKMDWVITPQSAQKYD